MLIMLTDLRHAYPEANDHIESGRDWLIGQQKPNGAWRFSSAWQHTSEYPQVVAESMMALVRAEAALIL